MKDKIFLAAISAVILASCGGKKSSSVFLPDDAEENEADTVEAYVGDTLHLFEEEVPPVSVDELFDDFFFNFASDPRFQKQRIRFPLVCKNGEEVTKLSRQDWADSNHFEGQEFFSVIYEHEQDMEVQKDTTLSQVTVDWVHLDGDYVEKFNFKRLDGKWVLMNVDREEIENVPNGEFLHFYSHFMTDSVLQHEALSVPVKLVLTPFSEDEEEQVEELTAEQWFEMRSDLPFPKNALVNIDYGQVNTNEENKTLLMEGLSNGFCMKFMFCKIDDNWKLVEVEY